MRTCLRAEVTWTGLGTWQSCDALGLARLAAFILAGLAVTTWYLQPTSVKRTGGDREPRRARVGIVQCIGPERPGLSARWNVEGLKELAAVRIGRGVRDCAHGRGESESTVRRT